MAKTLVVDKDKCIGCGACVAQAGKSFKMNTEGKSEAINPPQDDEATVQSSIDGCPVAAISWKE